MASRSCSRGPKPGHLDHCALLLESWVWKDMEKGWTELESLELHLLGSLALVAQSFLDCHAGNGSHVVGPIVPGISKLPESA